MHAYGRGAEPVASHILCEYLRGWKSQIILITSHTHTHTHPHTHYRNRGGQKEKLKRVMHKGRKYTIIGLKNITLKRMGGAKLF